MAVVPVRAVVFRAGWLGSGAETGYEAAGGVSKSYGNAAMAKGSLYAPYDAFVDMYASCPRRSVLAGCVK